MLGMAGIITGMMVEEQVREKIVSYVKENKKRLKKIFCIAMMVMSTIIVIILVDLIIKKNKKIDIEDNMRNYDATNINFVESTDENINKFISDYFKARTLLNYPKIFAAFGRDYYKEKRESVNIKTIEDTIRYERTFVRGYENIKVYKEKGFREGDIVCVVTYDLILGFTDDKAPMIIIFYLEPKDGKYVIKDSLDVGTSKYLMDCTNTVFIKELYADVEAKLNRLLSSNESMKLAYNSLRQFEMNMNGEINYEKKYLEGILEKGNFIPIEDVEKIYNDIKNKKRDELNNERFNEYLKKIIASLSELPNTSLVTN